MRIAVALNQCGANGNHKGAYAPLYTASALRRISDRRDRGKHERAPGDFLREIDQSRVKTRHGPVWPRCASRTALVHVTFAPPWARHHESAPTGRHAPPLTPPCSAALAHALRLLEPPARHGCMAIQVTNMRTRALALAARGVRDARWRASARAWLAASLLRAWCASAFTRIVLPRMLPPAACSAASLTSCAPIS